MRAHRILLFANKYYAFLCVLVILSFSSCDKGDENIDYSRDEPLSLDYNSDREGYRELFGSIVVPDFRGVTEPHCPEPFVYVIIDSNGSILHVRRPVEGSGRWGFDEVPANSVEDETSKVIVADKKLSMTSFFEVLAAIEQKFGTNHIWLQVWGVHPYPLQIPIDLKSPRFAELSHPEHSLQDFVNLED